MEAITFLGVKVPSEVKKLFPLFNKLQQTTIQKILHLTVQVLKGNELSENQFEVFAQELQLDKQVLSITITAFFIILRSAIRANLKPEVLEKDLQELKFPPFFIVEIVKVLKSSQSDIEKSLTSSSLHYNGVEEMKWRVDVTVSTSAMARVLKPSVLMQITTTDGNAKLFELSVEKFHEVRYSVAKLLLEMDTTEKNPILKITNK